MREISVDIARLPRFLAFYEKDSEDSVDCFLVVIAVTFLLLLVLSWRHNQSTHKRRYSQWERSFLCQRCGTLTEQE